MVFTLGEREGNPATHAVSETIHHESQVEVTERSGGGGSEEGEL